MRVSLLTIAVTLASAPGSAADPAPKFLIVETPTLFAEPEARPTSDMPVITPGVPKDANSPVTSRYEAREKKGERLGDRKLSELPPGDLYMAVYRRIDGCEVPIIAGYGMGRTDR